VENFFPVRQIKIWKIMMKKQRKYRKKEKRAQQKSPL